MKIIIERTKYEPVFTGSRITGWQVEWTIDTDTGINLFVPVTVHRNQFNGEVTEARITQQAFTMAMSSQILHLYKDVDVADELDELLEAEAKIVQQMEEAKVRLNGALEYRQQQIASAKEKLEQRKKEREKLLEDHKEQLADNKVRFGSGKSSSGN